jgi:SAM-dependent methyltransferase
VCRRQRNDFGELILNWRLKCVAFQILEHIPGGGVLYRWAQKFVTGSHLFEVTDAYLRIHQFHAGQYSRVHPGRALEFGGGRHFLSPLLLSNAGATEVLVYDIQRLSSPAQINHTIRQLRGRVAGEWPEIADWSDLERIYRIRYQAPGDARDTKLANASVNFVCSTSTLEHIPADDIRLIFKECARVAAPGAVFSHVIDYADHYRYGDESISLFNFYRYSESQWRWMNPPNHFQNRLRHIDFEGLFREQGWKPLKQTAGTVASDSIRDLPIDAFFRRYESADLLVSIGYFALTTA